MDLVDGQEDTQAGLNMAHLGPVEIPDRFEKSCPMGKG